MISIDNVDRACEMRQTNIIRRYNHESANSKECECTESKRHDSRLSGVVNADERQTE